MTRILHMRNLAGVRKIFVPFCDLRSAQSFLPWSLCRHHSGRDEPPRRR